MTLTTEEIEAHFTRSDGRYAFARWGRPIAPVVFGVEDQTLSVLNAALRALCELTTQDLAQTDPELGANLMVFFTTDWDQFLDVPDLDRMIPDLKPLIEKLKAVDANQYRIFRFDEGGAIKACFVLLRMDEHLGAVSADTLALSQFTQSMLLWSDLAFREKAPIAALEDGRVILRPEIADLMRAAYDPVMPAQADDASHALRLSARLNRAT